MIVSIQDVARTAPRLAACVGAPLRSSCQRPVPEPYVDAFLDFHDAGSFDESQVTSTVTDLTGRAPRTFRQWAIAHVRAF